MISDVVIIGQLDKKINKLFRYIKAYSNDTLHNDEKCSYIPLMYWTRTTNNLLMNKPDGLTVAIRGRIECDEEIGLYILVESINNFGDPAQCHTI